jgi:hypothetical protein
MPITIDRDPAHGWLLTQARGVVTYAELAAHLNEEEALRVQSDPELFDATGASTDITTAQVKTLVDRANTMLRNGSVGPTAFVANDDVAFGMARMYQLLAEPDGIVVGVFRDRGDAERWLADTNRAK